MVRGGPISPLEDGYEDLSELFPYNLEQGQRMRSYFGAYYIAARTKTVIRRCMQSTMDLPQHRQPDCILHQNCWKKSKRKAFTLHM